MSEIINGNLYAVNDDKDAEYVCSPSWINISEMGPEEYSSYENIIVQKKHLPTEFEFTLNMDKDEYKSFLEAIGLAPVPRAKRNQKIRNNFKKFIQRVAGRRHK